MRRLVLLILVCLSVAILVKPETAGLKKGQVRHNYSESEIGKTYCISIILPEIAKLA